MKTGKTQGEHGGSADNPPNSRTAASRVRTCSEFPAEHVSRPRFSPSAATNAKIAKIAAANSRKCRISKTGKIFDVEKKVLASLSKSLASQTPPATVSRCGCVLQRLFEWFSEVICGINYIQRDKRFTHCVNLSFSKPSVDCVRCYARFCAGMCV